MKHFAFFFPLLLSTVLLAETVGVRPYELDWAGRYEDEHPDAVLEDFESEGWTGECSGGTIAVKRSREQLLFGDYVLKATYCNNADTEGARPTSSVRRNRWPFRSRSTPSLFGPMATRRRSIRMRRPSGV